MPDCNASDEGDGVDLDGRCEVPNKVEIAWARLPFAFFRKRASRALPIGKSSGASIVVIALSGRYHNFR